ncbi:unnamed protein product [Cunninghamella blakesleeana]
MLLLLNSVLAGLNLGLTKDNNCDQSMCKNEDCANTDENKPDKFCGDCKNCKECEKGHLYVCNANGYTGCDFGPSVRLLLELYS